MARPLPLSLCLLLAGGLATPGAGQPVPADAATEPLPEVFVPTSAPAAVPPGAAPTVKPAVLSPALAAAIAPALPQFQAAGQASAATSPPPAKPRNEVPRLPVVPLPEVVVHARPLREFTEREILTRQGLEELAMHRYLSDFDREVLNPFALPLVGEANEARAMVLYRQDEDIRRSKEIGDLWKLERLKDPNPLPAAPAKAP